MSFFKKETKEDRDRRKSEKKTKNGLNESSVEGMMQQSIRINEGSDDLNVSTIADTLTSSSKSSIDSSGNNSHIGGSISSAPPSLLPKPKKGILKTMSKFGIGPTLSNPVISPPPPQQQQQQQAPVTTPPAPSQTIVSSPKLIKIGNIRTKPPIESSVPSYSKRSSQVIIDANFRRNSNDSNMGLPNIRHLPIYLSRLEVSSDPFGLLRSLNISPNLVNKIEIGEASSENEPKPVVLLSDLGLKILPGEQLVLVNGQSVIGLKIDEVDKLIKLNCDNLQLTIRSPPCFSEILMRGKDENGARRAIVGLGSHLSSSSSSLASSSSSLTGAERILARANSEDTDFAWVMHPSGYSMARVVSKTNDADLVAGSYMFKVECLLYF